MAKKTRFYRYRIAEVYEGAEGKIEIGQTLIDTWHGKSYTYQLERRGEIVPWCHVKLIGEVTEPETLVQLEGKR